MKQALKHLLFLSIIRTLIHDSIRELETAKSRGVAQMEEQRSPKPQVAGSNPAAPAIPQKLPEAKSFTVN